MENNKQLNDEIRNSLDDSSGGSFVDKFSYILMLINCLDVIKKDRKLTVESIMEEYQNKHYKGSFAHDIVLTENDIKTVLKSLTNFMHIRKVHDYYLLNPMGRFLIEVNNVGEYSDYYWNHEEYHYGEKSENLHLWCGKFPQKFED